MAKRAEKIVPGSRMFGKENKSLESSSRTTEITEASIPVFENSSMLLEETHTFPCVKGNRSRANARSQHTAMSKDEFAIPIGQQRLPSEFCKSLNVYSPLNSQASSDFFPQLYATDFYSPLYTPEVSTNYSSLLSSLSDNFQTPVDYSMSTFLPLQPSPVSSQEKAFCMSKLVSHEELRESLYSMTATDLSLRIFGELPDSPSESNLPLDSQDSECLLSDNDPSANSGVDSHPFTDMSYYHMVNTFKLPSTKWQILNEVPPVENSPETKQAPNSLISTRVNRHDVNRIQGGSTCKSGAGRSPTTFPLNQENLTQSVAKYSDSEDSGADVTTDEDLPLSPLFQENALHMSKPVSHEELRQSLYALTATDLYPTCISSSHDELKRSLYSMTATDLSLRISSKLSDSPSECNSPLDSQDSGCLSDDNDPSAFQLQHHEAFSSRQIYGI